MLIEYFKPSKKNLLTLYLLQTFYWTPGIIGGILSILNGNYNPIWNILGSIIEVLTLLMAYVYSKRARPELRHYYAEILKIVWRYIKGVVFGIILGGIIFAIYTICLLPLCPQMEPYVDLSILGIWVVYVIYLVGRYYVQTIKGFLSVRRSLKTESSAEGSAFLPH